MNSSELFPIEPNNQVGIQESEIRRRILESRRIIDTYIQDPKTAADLKAAIDDVETKLQQKIVTKEQASQRMIEIYDYLDGFQAGGQTQEIIDSQKPNFLKRLFGGIFGG